MVPPWNLCGGSSHARMRGARLEPASAARGKRESNGWATPVPTSDRPPLRRSSLARRSFGRRNPPGLQSAFGRRAPSRRSAGTSFPKIMICCSSIRSGVLYQELAPKQVGRRTPIITYDYANASSGIPQRSAPGTAGLYRCPGLTGKAFANPCLGSEVIVAYWASKEQGGTMATGISFFFVSKRRHTPSVGASQPKTYGLISHKGQLYSGRRSVIDVRKRDKKERPL